MCRHCDKYLVSVVENFTLNANENSVIKEAMMLRVEPNPDLVRILRDFVKQRCLISGSKVDTTEPEGTILLLSLYIHHSSRPVRHIAKHFTF
jgi:hypothetical protein